jgi:two-component sensor histidine kinase
MFLMPASSLAQENEQGGKLHNRTADPAYRRLLRAIDTAERVGLTDTLSAESRYLKIIAEAKHSAFDYIVGQAYYKMGEMYFSHKNHNRSFGSFFNARDNFKKVGAKKELAYTLFGLGRQQYFRGNYKVATQHLNFAVSQARGLKLAQLESDALEYMGILFRVMPTMTTEGIAEFKRALSIKGKLNDHKGMLRMMQKLGAVYYEREMYDTALQYLDASVNLSQYLGLKHDEAIARLNRAGAYIQSGNIKKAGSDIDEIRLKADTLDMNINVRLHIQQGNYSLANEQFLDSKNHYAYALVIADRTGVPEMYGMVYKHMANAYSKRKMYKEAYEYAEKYNTQVTGYYAENLRILKELDQVLNSINVRDELSYANLQNNLKEISLKNEKRLRVILLTAIGVFLLLAIIIFYLYKTQKNKNSLIKKQADDLQTLMKEIHHRLKNNLQIISSLLDLQSRTVGDKQAAQAIKEGRNRVQTMAIIHQNLYGEEHFKGIAVVDYIDTLVRNLFDSYNIQPGGVMLQTDIEKMNLDVDTIIPVGLVLNELISNSLKYAFAEGETGTIEVTLKKVGAALLLKVRDDGKGFSQPADTVSSSSFGMRMIKIFAKKLKADLDIYNDQGACISMRIRNFKMAEK